MTRCFICRTYTDSPIRVEGRIAKDIVQVCSSTCQDEIEICQGCGFQSTDQACSEECSHQMFYGTRPDVPEDTPALDPPWYANS